MMKIKQAIIYTVEQKEMQVPILWRHKIWCDVSSVYMWLLTRTGMEGELQRLPTGRSSRLWPTEHIYSWSHQHPFNGDPLPDSC